MKTKLALKIDVTKIKKERLYKGKKGTYLDAIVVFDDGVDQYGNNGFVVEGQTKEEREAQAEQNFIGNVKILWQPKPEVPAEVTRIIDIMEDGDDDLPF